jgi:hypothetical protein
MDEPKFIGKITGLPIEYAYPEEALCGFANHFTIIQNEHEVIFCFYQVQPPMAKNDVEAKQMLGERRGVPAQLVAKIAVPRSRFQSFVESMKITPKEG